ncbi:Xylosidase/arabinosidase [Penicillium argentinense]|uniref:Xylosidase/arabinosidase n=1 Tax=Penicillium argentinense TaxID=1131581 RepID=A0A9W9JY26_9EURO|nr:Xylosidase/arabinosidase [Penicillium argentinense]KAJ5085695.1 Xylosidase/arabinosidase [Penicillium argentinense]
MTPQPLITHLYTADPSAHVFNNKLYIYPSHDRETDIAFNDNGDQYDMTDYHVFSMETIDGPVTDHGVVLAAKDVPWVSKQMWAPDAATKNGKYYLYFPARDQEGIFRIGVAVANSPEGPFLPEKEFIAGSYSIDPASFVDEDGEGYLYFGGIWGGQLQCWKKDGKGLVFDASKTGPQEPSGEGVLALCPRVAQLSEDMLSFVEPPRDLQILAPETGEPLLADDHERRFLRRRGCIGTAGSTISLTRLVTRIFLSMRLGIRRSVRLRIRVGFWSLCWAGRRIIRLLNSQGSGICSIMIVNCRKVSIILDL